jgi:hypothetical protein
VLLIHNASQNEAIDIAVVTGEIAVTSGIRVAEVPDLAVPPEQDLTEFLEENAITVKQDSFIDYELKQCTSSASLSAWTTAITWLRQLIANFNAVIP